MLLTTKYRIAVSNTPQMTVPQRESSGFFMTFPPAAPPGGNRSAETFIFFPVSLKLQQRARYRYVPHPGLEAPLRRLGAMSAPQRIVDLTDSNLYSRRIKHGTTVYASTPSLRRRRAGARYLGANPRLPLRQTSQSVCR